MAARKRRRSQSARPAEPRSVQQAPPPAAAITDPDSPHKSLWQKAIDFFTSVRGIISTIGAIVVALGSVFRFFTGDFDDRVVAERNRLYATNASVEDRMDAIRTLSELPSKRRQYEKVASILETSLVVRVTAGGSGQPCGEALASDPRIVQRTLLALAAVNTRAQRPLALDHADLRGLQADSIVLDGARITRSCLSGVQLNGAHLRKVDFTGSDLRGAAMEGARLDSARLRNVNLTNVNLNNAVLTDADLIGARLQGVSAVNTDFTLADMTNTRLDSADISFACLAGASLAGADFRGVQYWNEVRSFRRTYLGHIANAPEGLRELAAQHGGIITSLTLDSLASLRAASRIDWRGSGKSTCVRDS